MSTHFTIYTDLLTFAQSHDFITDADAYARYLEQNDKQLMLNSSFDKVTHITSSNGTDWDAEEEEDEYILTLDLKESGIKIAYDTADPEYTKITVDGHTQQIDSRETSEFDTFMRDMFAPIEESNYLLAIPNTSRISQTILHREGIWDYFRAKDGTLYSDSEVRKNFHGFTILTPLALTDL